MSGLLKDFCKSLQLEFEKKHISKPLSFWESVHFSDKSKFNMYGSDDRVMVWRKLNQQILIKNFF